MAMLLRLLCFLAMALVAAAAHGAPPEKPTLVPRAEIRALIERAPWECYHLEPVTRSCAMIGRTRWTDETRGTGQMAMLLSEEPRMIAMISSPIWADGDMDCARLGDLTVEILSVPSLSEESTGALRAAMLQSFTRQGEISCTGVVRDGDHFRTITITDGKLQDEQTPVHLLSERPELRAGARGI